MERNSMNIGCICNHSFIEDKLSSTACVVDCGVNLGEFSSAVSHKWQCMIHGLEPDPRLFPNLPSLANCTFHQLALTDQKRSMTLNLGDTQCSSLIFKEDEGADSVEIEAISLPDFCSENGIEKIDLLKLDIEGAEIGVLNHLTDDWIRTTVAQLTVEFHEFLDPEVVPEIEKIIQRLKQLGFHYLPFSLTYGDVLFVNRKYIRLSTVDKLHLFAIKYARGGLRLLARVRGKSPS